jgi:hypothetical protein
VNATGGGVLRELFESQRSRFRQEAAEIQLELEGLVIDVADEKA